MIAVACGATGKGSRSPRIKRLTIITSTPSAKTQNHGRSSGGSGTSAGSSRRVCQTSFSRKGAISTATQTASTPPRLTSRR